MKKFAYLVLTLFMLSVTLELNARAGGGGGRRSSSSSSSSSSWSSSDYSSSSRSGSSGSLPGQWWMYAVGVGGILVMFYMAKKYASKDSGVIKLIGAIPFIGTVVGESAAAASGDEQKIVSRGGKGQAVISDAFMAVNPGFSKGQFKDKVKTAFVAIQNAWQDQNLGKVRKWISDGVYQRFSIQFEMMKQLGQKNILSNISIDQVQFVRAYTEGNFSIITVGIDFTMDDKFVSEKLPKLNESYKGEQAVEYWTFVKKSGPNNKDLYHSNNCPNCGSGLSEDGGEVSKCPSCGTVTYLGDYDWVLSEITQSDDFVSDVDYDPSNPQIEEIRKEEEFCMQNMEDKASNAFVHYLMASAWNKSASFNRFGTDEVVSAIDAETDEPYVFNRVYVNKVSYSYYVNSGDRHELSFMVNYSGQKVKLSDNKVKKVDDDIVSRIASLTLSRKIGAASKSKLWSHECAGCGAPYADSTSTKCAYCGAKINSADNDWIVTNLIAG